MVKINLAFVSGNKIVLRTRVLLYLPNIVLEKKKMEAVLRQPLVPLHLKACLSLLGTILSMVSYPRQEYLAFSQQQVIDICFEYKCFQGYLCWNKQLKKLQELPDGYGWLLKFVFPTCGEHHRRFLYTANRTLRSQSISRVMGDVSQA